MQKSGMYQLISGPPCGKGRVKWPVSTGASDLRRGGQGSRSSASPVSAIQWLSTHRGSKHRFNLRRGGQGSRSSASYASAIQWLSTHRGSKHHFNLRRGGQGSHSSASSVSAIQRYNRGRQRPTATPHPVNPVVVSTHLRQQKARLRAATTTKPILPAILSLDRTLKLADIILMW